MHFHSVSRLMNRVSRVARRGRRQTKHGARCSSPCEQRVLLLCERLEDRLAPAVHMIYDQMGDLAIQGKGDIELTEYQLGQQKFLKVDVGEQGFDHSSSQPVPGRLMYFPTGSPDGSNFALVFDNTPNSIPTLRITGKSDVSLTIPNLNSGIDTVLVEADRATFVQYDDRRGFVKVKEADINGPTTIANLTAAKTIVNSIQANFLGRNNFGDLDVNQGGGVSLNGDATAGAVEIHNGNMSIGLNGRLDVDGSYHLDGGTMNILGWLSLEDGGKLNNGITNVVGGAVTVEKTLKIQGGVYDQNPNGQMHIEAAAEVILKTGASMIDLSGGDMLLRGKMILNGLGGTYEFGPASRVTGSGNVKSSNATVSVTESLVNIGTYTQQGGALNSVNSGLQLLMLDLRNTLFTAIGSNISVGGTMTATDASINMIASFINSPEYRQRFGGIRIDPTSKFTVTDDVSVDDSGKFYVGGNLFARKINVNHSDLIVDGTAIGNGRNNGGTVSGFGILVGNWDNNGLLIPGRTGQPGVLTINGNYTQGNAGTLCIQFDANRFAELVVTDMARLDGTLALKAINNFVPMPNAQGLFLNAGTIDGAFTDVDLNLPNPWQAELFKSPNAFFVKLTQPF